jgi:hypothetical protein|tara:strand:- start:1 stop:186 length:186 start_codon:yes stop_codon:yes gene_type:complete
MEFSKWLSKCDTVVLSTLGLGLHDMPDANWRDYFDDGLSPKDAFDTAAEDHWQDEMAMLYD